MDKKRSTTKRPSPTLGPTHDLGMVFHTAGYCQMIDMLLDRLDQQDKEMQDDETIVESDRTRVDYAKRYLKAARSSLSQLITDRNDRLLSEIKSTMRRK